MDIGWNIETILTISSIIGSITASYFIVKIDWKKYGLLFFTSAVAGILLCYLFIGLGLYSFPYRLFPDTSTIPFPVIVTVFPFLVIFGVRFSPKAWPWKLPFYWTMVHIGMFSETWMEHSTRLIQYDPKWSVWDSYTWWWIYLLVFEGIGGLIVTPALRKPVDIEKLRYGKMGFFIIHFILIITIFLAGVYMGYGFRISSK